MNRKERRKKGVKLPAKTYTLNELQIQKLKNDAVTTAIEKAQVVVLYNTLLVLRDEYGFGKKRLESFTEQWFELLDGVQEGFLDFKDMIDTIEDETGFKIERKA